MWIHTVQMCVVQGSTVLAIGSWKLKFQRLRLPTRAKRWTNPSVHGRTDGRINKTDNLHNGILFSLKQEGDSDTCHHSHEP